MSNSTLFAVLVSESEKKVQTLWEKNCSLQKKVSKKCRFVSKNVNECQRKTANDMVYLD
jgi:hypothetical protein